MHGDKTYTTFVRGTPIINLRGVSTRQKYYKFRKIILHHYQELYML